MIGGVRYQRVVWDHRFDYEPVVLWSEVGDDGYERRKVDEYRDGRLEWADDVGRSGTTMLGDQRVPPLDELNASGEFAAAAIVAAEFEEVWQRARS